MNFAKFPRTFFFTEHLRRLLLDLYSREPIFTQSTHGIVDKQPCSLSIFFNNLPPFGLPLIAKRCAGDEVGRQILGMAQKIIFLRSTHEDIIM